MSDYTGADVERARQALRTCLHAFGDKFKAELDGHLTILESAALDGAKVPGLRAALDRIAVEMEAGGAWSPEEIADRTCSHIQGLESEMSALQSWVAEMKLQALRAKYAEALADEVAVLVRRKVIDSRSPAADALLDFRDPPSTPRADRMAGLEGGHLALQAQVTELTEHLAAADKSAAAAANRAEIARTRVEELEREQSKLEKELDARDAVVSDLESERDALRAQSVRRAEALRKVEHVRPFTAVDGRDDRPRCPVCGAAAPMHAAPCSTLLALEHVALSAPPTEAPPANDADEHRRLDNLGVPAFDRCPATNRRERMSLAERKEWLATNPRLTEPHGLDETDEARCESEYGSK